MRCNLTTLLLQLGIPDSRECPSVLGPGRIGHPLASNSLQVAGTAETELLW